MTKVVLGFESLLRQMIRAEVAAGLRGSLTAVPERRPAHTATRCACGCGRIVAVGNRFVRYHHLKLVNERKV